MMKTKLIQRSKTNKSKKQAQSRKYRRLEAQKRFVVEMWQLKHSKKEKKSD